MGQVVPFIARLRDSGDWTAAERARLQELADRLADSGVRVEVIFGATDEGDPWCVVTDEGGDVLIHVARIDGKFVVHSAVDDAVNESADLHAALLDRLEATEEAVAPRSATILPFGLSARQGQTFLALLAATTFFYETASIGDSAEAAPAHLPPAEDPPPPPPEDTDAPAHDRETVAQGAALQPSAGGTTALAAAGPAAEAAASERGPAPTLSVAPEEQPVHAPQAPVETAPAAAPPADARILIQGTAGDDLLVGTKADEHIVGGDGNDTLRGGGGHDLLEGGAGDDVIEITGQSVAIGGAGADSFVVAQPVQLGRAETLLGVILDYNRAQGDGVFSWTGEAVRLMPHRTPGDDGDKTAPPVTPGTDGGLTTTTTPPTDGGGFGPTTVAPPTTQPGSGDPTTLTRVDVDLDGDGHLDGYLLLAPPPGLAGQFDANAVTSGRLGVLTRYDVDLDGDGASDGYILMGPRGLAEVTVTSVGVAFSYSNPFS